MLSILKPGYQALELRWSGDPAEIGLEVGALARKSKQAHRCPVAPVWKIVLPGRRDRHCYKHGWYVCGYGWLGSHGHQAAAGLKQVSVCCCCFLQHDFGEGLLQKNVDFDDSKTSANRGNASVPFTRLPAIWELRVIDSLPVSWIGGADCWQRWVFRLIRSKSKRVARCLSAIVAGRNRKRDLRFGRKIERKAAILSPALKISVDSCPGLLHYWKTGYLKEKHTKSLPICSKEATFLLWGIYLSWLSGGHVSTNITWWCERPLYPLAASKCITTVMKSIVSNLFLTDGYERICCQFFYMCVCRQ